MHGLYRWNNSVVYYCTIAEFGHMLKQKYIFHVRALTFLYCDVLCHKQTSHHFHGNGNLVVSMDAVSMKGGGG